MIFKKLLKMILIMKKKIIIKMIFKKLLKMILITKKFLFKMFYEIDLRMFKDVYKSSTKILQIGSCGKFQPH
jgi:hypothetical protein